MIAHTRSAGHQPPAWSGCIEPVFPCGSAADAALPAHPALIEAAQRIGVFYVRYWASEPELVVPGRARAPPIAQADAGAKDAALAHTQSSETRRMSSRVCTLAWNAERTLQSMLVTIGLEAGREYEDPRGSIAIRLSDGNARVADPVRPEDAASKHARLQRAVDRADQNVRLYAERHFAELRRAMNLIEEYCSDPQRYIDKRTKERAAKQTLAASDPSLSDLMLSGTDQQHDESAETGAIADAIRSAAAGLTSSATYENFAYAVWVGAFSHLADDRLWRLNQRQTARALADANDGSQSRTGRTLAAAQSLGWGWSYQVGMDADRFPFVGLSAAQMDLSTQFGRDKMLLELARLRSSDYDSLDGMAPDVRRARNAEPSSVWAQNAGDIQRLAFSVFLNPDVHEWRLDRVSTAPANPNAAKRREAYEFVVGTPTSMPEGSDVAFSRDMLVIHSAEQTEAHKNLMTESDIRRAQAAERVEVQGRVRIHAAVAGIVGATLARAMLGDAAPELREFQDASGSALSGADLAELQRVVDRIDAAVGSSGGPAALRFNELCAIIEPLLP